MENNILSIFTCCHSIHNVISRSFNCTAPKIIEIGPALSISNNKWSRAKDTSVISHIVV